MCPRVLRVCGPWHDRGSFAKANRVIVKKYGNRRLYDTEDSRYVRLGEIATKIRRGIDVRVVDAQTDADLTAETLVQIIFEDRHAARLLPVTLLQQMIRMGDDALAEFLGRYVSFALEMYLQAKDAQKSAGMLSPFSALAPLAPLAAIAALPFRAAASAASAAGVGRRARGDGAAKKAAEESAAAAVDANATVVVLPDEQMHTDAATRKRDDDVAELRRELEELKKSLRKKRG